MIPNWLFWIPVVLLLLVMGGFSISVWEFVLSVVRCG